jgi:predicted lipoprotein with Yx(FWY)xxD motif
MKKVLIALAAPALAASIATTAIGAATASSTLDVRQTLLGRTLVDGRGRTLYMFKADRANMSNCAGACLTVWPAMSASVKPHASGGAVAAKIGIIRAHGRRQVTYAGHPLYYYIGDRTRGDVNGEGLNQFGGKWYALRPSGRVIDHD